MKKNKYILLTLISLLFLSLSCREEIALETEAFESVLVIEATITNEIKYQEVNLSRTYFLEASEQLLENNATVYIEDNIQNIYTFTQNQDGVYVSDIEFKAQTELIYTLHVTTSIGENYKSNPTILTPEASISNLYAELVNGEDVTVFVDVDGTENNAQYFRYEWEETYKIIAPHHTNFDATVVNYQVVNGQVSYDVAITPREQEEKTCFSAKKSPDIIQATSSELANNIITHFPIRVLDKNNPKLITRYSILVNQITQNIESYSYYKTINELGNAASILSSNQPGYIQSNITALANTNEKVLGFFNVAAITKKRVYFNYTDFNIREPDYFYECSVIELDYNDNTTEDMDTNERIKLYQLLALGDYKYISSVSTFYKITRPECGDCTSFSSNIQPDFWID
jgi:hypothetical protein